MEYVTPPPAIPGDEVAVVAPSARLAEPVVEIGLDRLRELELEPTVYPSVRADERLAPADRAREIHDAFASEATAVVAVTGGEDQMRLLRHLDRDHLATNPTRYYGISDNTCLHHALNAAGIVSYYGGQFVPGIALDLTLPEYTERYLRRALFEESIGDIEPAERWTDDYFHFGEGKAREWECNPGWTWDFPDDETVSGTLWGGCLVVLKNILAANRRVPAPEDVSGNVLAVETSELLPDPYYVRSALRCLGERGLLSQFSALVVGRPKTRHKEPRTDAEREAYRNDQRDAIRTVAREYNPDVPILFDLDFGHTDPHVPVPIGGQVTLDPVAERISFD